MLLSYITFASHGTKYTKRRGVSYSFLSCVSLCAIKYDGIEYSIIIFLFDFSYTNLFRRLTFPNLVFSDSCSFYIFLQFTKYRISRLFESSSLHMAISNERIAYILYVYRLKLERDGCVDGTDGDVKIQEHKEYL